MRNKRRTDTPPQLFSAGDLLRTISKAIGSSAHTESPISTAFQMTLSDSTSTVSQSNKHTSSVPSTAGGPGSTMSSFPSTNDTPSSPTTKTIIFYPSTTSSPDSSSSRKATVGPARDPLTTMTSLSTSQSQYHSPDALHSLTY